MNKKRIELTHRAFSQRPSFKMFMHLRPNNALRREDTAAETVFNQERGGRDHKKSSKPRNSSFSQMLRFFTRAVAVAWVSWITAEILLWKCGENPHSIACSVKIRAFPIGDHSSFQLMSGRNWLHDTRRTPRNFAAGGDGAVVFKAFTSPTSLTPVDSTNTFTKRPSPVPPSAILDDSIAIGRCWEFAGQQGHVGIKLNENVHIGSVSLNNVHPSLITSTSARKAPRDFTLWALYEGPFLEGLSIASRPASHFLFSKPFPPGISAASQFIQLVNSSYDISSFNTHQTFEVSSFFKGIPTPPINFVILEISSNWGAPSTCVYSVGIHEEIML